MGVGVFFVFFSSIYVVLVVYVVFYNIIRVNLCHSWSCYLNMYPFPQFGVHIKTPPTFTGWWGIQHFIIDSKL